jgi:hypothetical protein
MAGDGTSARPVVVIADIANVMGSRPDGWWKDRAGAATALLDGMPELVGSVVGGPDGGTVRIERLIAVVEGAAKAATGPAGIEVVRAPADGDSTIVAVAEDTRAAGARVVVVTADRGLRARLDADAIVAGPGWLNALLGR